MKFCNILKTGKFTDSKGNEHEFTREKLDKICENFEKVHKNVPICVGHPVSGAPAYGWLDKVKRVGDDLYCTFKDVQKEFAEAVNKGLFKNRSISLDKDLNIRHLAFLGAQAPAVKGLEDFCFEADENAADIEFSDFADAETLDMLFGKTPEPAAKTPEPEKTDDELEKVKKELSEQTQKAEELAKELETEREKAKIKDFEDFAAGAVENGNILPKHKNGIVNILLAADRFKTFDFADAGEKDAVQSVKDFIGELKAIDLKPAFPDPGAISDFADYTPADWARAISKAKTDAKNGGYTIDTATAVQNIKKGEK